MVPKLDDSDPSKWTYPPHTRAKHEILKSYLGGWFPKLTLGGNQRVLFLDGFAGRGSYANGDKGSPIIALETLLDHSHFDRMRDFDFVFLFIEANNDNVRHLESTVDQFKAEREPWPSNVKVQIYDASFEDTASSMISYLQTQKSSLAPTFAFIDPFGFKGMKMSTIADLLNHRACEVFVNFMIMYVNRFLEQEYMGSNMNDLFGLEVPKILEGHDVGTRISHLHDVYRQQLETRAGFPYVQSFAMKNDHGNIEYYLFHGTRAPEGVSLMKDAMWKLDPLGHFTFDDRSDGQSPLPQLTAPDLKPLREMVLREFSGRRAASSPEVKDFVILKTLYRLPHLTQVLRELEKEKLIKVDRPHSRAQFGDRVKIDFP